MRGKVCISVATHGPVRVELVEWLLREFARLRERCYIDLVYSTKGVQHARNLQVERFLATDCTHIYFVDSDCVPSPHDVLDNLLFIGKPVLSTPAPQNVRGEVGLMMVDKTKDGYVYHRHDYRICKVDAVGTTGLFVAREVFEQIPPPWFECHYDEKGLLKLGEDFDFCEKVRAAGYEIWAVPKFAQKHVKEVVLSA